MSGTGVLLPVRIDGAIFPFYLLEGLADSKKRLAILKLVSVFYIRTAVYRLLQLSLTILLPIAGTVSVFFR